MNANPGFQLTSGLLNSMLALLIWSSLGAGVHSLVTGATALGVVEIGLAVAIIALWVFGDLLGRARERQSPGVGLILGFFAFVMMLFGVFRLSDLTRNSFMIRGEIQIPETIRAVSTAGFYFLLALFLYQLLVAFRNRSRSLPSQGTE